MSEFLSNEVLEAHYQKLSTCFSEESGDVRVPSGKKTLVRGIVGDAVLGGVNVRHVTIAFITTDDTLYRQFENDIHEYITKNKKLYKFDDYESDFTVRHY